MLAIKFKKKKSFVPSESLSANVQPSVQLAKLADNVVFRCEITGHPVASVTWLHNGVPIENANGKELVRQNVEMSDGGIYQCIVKNNVKMVQSTAELRFSGS